ncbi:alpha/beta hydrolase family protein [Streptacidiphilus cavernicola]|uniref:Alpha/beta hydrolase family protein n=1 Tax=Streptacidiphilus cavernicola TaxID=3342716 RepID=A0ABV6VR54_9ACTN
MAQVRSYGEWPSPITAEAAAAQSGGRNWPAVVGPETWWCGADPASATVRLLRSVDGAAEPVPVLGAGWSVRNLVQGYGGRPYLVVPGRQRHTLVFTEHRDQRLYRASVLPLGATEAADAGDGASARPEPAPLTPVADGTWYADPVLGPDGTEVWCVRETTRSATGPDDADPAGRTSRDLVAVPLDGSAAEDGSRLRTVARSHHFLSGVRPSPDGRRLAWIGWDHPRMPWETTDLMVADLVDGVAVDPRRVLGGGDVSVPQAEWADDGALYAMADPDGWWNLHRITFGSGADADGGTGGGADKPECVLPMPRECAGPLWQVGGRWFAPTRHGVVLRHGVGEQRLELWDGSQLRGLAEGWTEFGDVSAEGDHVVLIAGSPTRGRTVLRIPLTGPDPDADADSDTTPGAPVECDPAPADPFAAWRSTPERRIAPGPHGREVHYVYYPPAHLDCAAPEGERPPLLVHVHGGPTSATSATPNLEFSLFCSRGFAVASVDYGGSTGYGREYRERLHHTWGVVDVEDSVAVAADLAALGLADPARTAIRGGSAGGWTTLAALTSVDAFCAGAVYYPISSPEEWTYDQTHDFESRYLDSLIGELPRDLERYRSVSPLGHADRISSPMVVLQGADDFICRPDQAERIVAVVAERGLWHRYLLFAGEGHGFRMSESVSRSLRAEAELYSHTMGITVTLD